MSGRDKDGNDIVEYGYYPQMAVSKKIQKELENAYNKKILNTTGNKYTIDSRRYDDYGARFEPITLSEYFYDGKKYVRVKANSYYDKFKLSNGEEYKNGEYVWVEVSKVRWKVSKEAKIILAEKLLFAGVQFNHERNYKGDFNSTDMKVYLDNCFAKDLLQNQPIIEKKVIVENFKKTRLEMLNPDKTSTLNRRKMTDTELIQDWIESGQTILLRGPSGIGKTERIKKLYPDLIYIKLTNNMFPEKVVGSVNLQTGQSIPPEYAKQAIMSCANEEEIKLLNENIQNIYKLVDPIYERSKNSSKKIVILLDELLNVKPVVQSLVYTLVLDRLVEIGKGLKLPANTVIVATGNQKRYSSVAEDAVAPLEKRFDHILDMQPKVLEWVNEYAIPNKVHPSVVGYILSKYMQSGRSEEISKIGYFYEEPEVGEKNIDINGCRGKTNDPRGWVSVSNTLYNFEKNLLNGKYIGKNVENILRVSLNTKLGQEWVEEFYNFYNKQTISVNDVVNESYKESDLPNTIDERFDCATALLYANNDQIEVCRKFIRKYCDPEYLGIYDLCWIGNDISRMEKINELQSIDMLGEEVKTR